MGFIYPDFATAFDYIPQDSIIILCDQSNLHRSAKTRTEDIGLMSCHVVPMRGTA
jgi:hypothetical protein